MALPGCQHRNRGGITIIEMVVVMSGVAAVLGLCAVTIQLLLRLSTDGQARLNAATTLERLATQFREDVHDCEAASHAEKSQGKGGETAAHLRLSIGPRRAVTYEARDGRVVRVESESGKSTRHESYALARGGLVQFQFRDQDSRRFVVLVVTQSPGKEPLEVLALQGRNRLQLLKQPRNSPR
jgi:hypothetical protein